MPKTQIAALQTGAPRRLQTRDPRETTTPTRRLNSPTRIGVRGSAPFLGPSVPHTFLIPFRPLPSPPSPPTQLGKETTRFTPDARLALARIAILSAVLIASMITAVLTNIHGGGHVYTVASESMEPVIERGALVVTGSNHVGEGDIIVYWSPVGQHQVHRIVEVIDINGHILYRAQGDANPGADAFLVPHDDVQGKVLLDVPYTGYPWLMPPDIQWPLFAILCAGYLAIVAWDARRTLGTIRMSILALFLASIALLPFALAAVHIENASSQTLADVADPSPIPLESGTTGIAEIANLNNSATIQVRSGQPQFSRTIPLWNCHAHNLTLDGCVYRPGATYDPMEVSTVLLYARDYNPTPDFYLEAFGRSGTGTLQVKLYNFFLASDVAGSELNITTNTSTLQRIGPFSITMDDEITFQARQTGNGAELYDVRLVAVHREPIKSTSWVRLAGGSNTDLDVYQAPSRGAQWLHNASEWPQTTKIEMRAVMNITSGKVKLAMYDLTDDKVLKAVSTGATTPTFVKQSVNLIDGHEYEIRYSVDTAGAGRRAYLHHAAIAVVQDPNFASSVRILDVAARHITTNTTYQSVLPDARTNGTDTWDITDARFEVTMEQEASETATARLWDLTSNEVQTTLNHTATGRDRIRSNTINHYLNERDHRVEIKSTNGTQVNITYGRILYFEERPGTPVTYHNHTLKMRPNTGPCTWQYHLQHTANATLTRVTNATLTLYGQTMQDQILIAAGNVTQENGTPVQPNATGVITLIIDLTTSSNGVSRIWADIVGQCGGVRTQQSLEVILA